MREYSNALILTQEEVYDIVKKFITQALEDMIQPFMEGHGSHEDFNKFYNLRNNTVELMQFFLDLCVEDVLHDTGAQIIVIVNEHDNPISKVIFRHDYETQLDLIANGNIQSKGLNLGTCT